ncbi:MAG: anthranilate phosphoribosyltransferase [Saprospiraceae bacterium]|nr:anthranilate phosphoribosyltransferase [Saprospiraceae bacterium]
MKEALNHLFSFQSFSRSEAKELLKAMSAGQFNDAQMTAFITTFRMRDIQVEELKGFVDALLELRVPIDFSAYDTIDVCGTGGDKKNTFNISTLTAFVLAGAGYKVAKHGNYGVSSACGSSNVLEHLGYQFTNDLDRLERQIEQAHICFFHAPLFHPAMKAVGPIRKQLGLVTFFNMLGPLVNPAQPHYQLTGVFNRNLARLYHYQFQKTDKQYMIVHSLDGYDEVSLTGSFIAKSPWYEREIHPDELGLPVLKPEQLHGGDTVAEAATIFSNVLQNQGTPAQTDAVLANAALGIQCFHPDWSLTDCVASARESLESNQAYQAFTKLIELSKS